MRDKFLTEAMGWKHWNSIGDKHYYIPTDFVPRDPELMLDFSTWDAFGVLWNWAQQQEWWTAFAFKHTGHGTFYPDGLIHPDRFADAVYNFLKES